MTCGIMPSPVVSFRWIRVDSTDFAVRSLRPLVRRAIANVCVIDIDNLNGRGCNQASDERERKDGSQHGEGIHEEQRNSPSSWLRRMEEEVRKAGERMRDHSPLTTDDSQALPAANVDGLVQPYTSFMESRIFRYGDVTVDIAAARPSLQHRFMSLQCP